MECFCGQDMWQKGNSYFMVCIYCGNSCKIDVKNKKVIWKADDFKIVSD
jgi:hypothetical protein